MPAKVIDASVLGAIAFGESRKDEATALMDGAELYAPRLLPYELVSIALKKSKLEGGLSEEIRNSLTIAFNVEIRWVEPDHQGILEIAQESGLSAYDAAYLHASRSLGLPLITFDERLKAAFNI